MANDSLHERLKRSKPITPDFFTNTIEKSGETATNFVQITAG
ncbi:MAG: hypothetical protein NTX38_17955 [Methylobacter sp.]|nr:hypothetical protein [Methylobacter sp.]